MNPCEIEREEFDRALEACPGPDHPCANNRFLRQAFALILTKSRYIKRSLPVREIPWQSWDWMHFVNVDLWCHCNLD